MSKTLSPITLTILCLTVLLSGCGAGEDDALTSLVLPIDFAPSLLNTLAQDGFAVTVTITASDMEDITRVQNITSIPRDGEAREIVIDNIPVGFNRTVEVEISKGGEVLFEGKGTVKELSIDGENHVDIPLRSLIPVDIPISERILGTWILTNTPGVGLVVNFRRNGTFILTDIQGIQFLRQYKFSGNRITLINGDVEITGIVEINDGRMEITYQNGVTEIYEIIHGVLIEVAKNPTLRSPLG